jgi:hypothetical protein
MLTCCRRPAGLLCLAVLSGLLAFTPDTGAGEARAPAKPRLAVLVYFDQLRGDYLTRWDDLFGADGFHRLERDGAWFQDCHYPYANTVTGAGHASVAAGCSPDRHGVVGNEWYDREHKTKVNCVGSERYERVPPAPGGTGATKMYPGVSPERLLAPTLADALKAATGGAARVVSLSFKDRGAVLPGGVRPDACYWFDGGRFVTSTYYRDRPHDWVADYNAGRAADRWFGRQWTRLRPDLDYRRYSGPDDMPGEGKGAGQGVTFPHPFPGVPRPFTGSYYSALYDSPFGNDVLLDLARRAIDAERLGRHDAPDLLCLSFSSNDAVGHTWGPDSQEVLDVTLRTDLVVRDLLAYLDAKVGEGRYVLALTADHGVCPLPEVARAQGKDAGRIPPSLLKTRANAFLTATFGGSARTRWVEEAADPWVYLNEEVARAHGLETAKVAEALAAWLKRQPGIQAAYTRAQLLHGLPPEAVGQSVRRSFYPDRCGDVAVVVKPYYIVWPDQTGTTHGTPHPYDTHVPLLVYGPGVKKGVRRDRVTPQAAAVVLARALGIAPPEKAEVGVPEGLFYAGPR